MEVKKNYLYSGVVFVVVLGALLFFKTSGVNFNTLTGNAVGGRGASSSFEEAFLKIDPSYAKIGVEVVDVELTNLLDNSKIRLNEIDRPVVLESFYAGCPSCTEGIKDYNVLYDTYGEDIMIIYLNFNSADDEQKILSVKNQVNGRDWFWVKYDDEYKQLLTQLGITGPGQTSIIDKGIVMYGDSIDGYMERVIEEVEKVL